jgi:hypothetical protein
MSDQTQIYTRSQRLPGQSIEGWIEQELDKIANLTQQGGQMSPLSIDLDSLADGQVVAFDATTELWTNATITIPGTLPPPDDDYGDITVSGGVWTIDADTVTFDKLVDATQAALIGAAAAGTFGEVTIGAGLEINGGALNVTASGSKIIRNWLPTDASFPSSNYATLDIRNTHPVLDFDDSTFESAYFHGVMPDNYEADASVVVEVYFCMTSATSGAVNFAIRLENMQGLDIDSDGFASYGGFTDTVPGTAGQVTSATATLTLASSQLDSLTAGDLFRLHVARNGANVADTATGDAEVIMVEMRIA